MLDRYKILSKSREDADASGGKMERVMKQVGKARTVFELAVESCASIAVLGNWTRMEIFSLLLSPKSRKMSVGDIVSRLGMSQPAVSEHLAVLRREGLVIREQDGQYAHYRASRKALLEKSNALKKLLDGIGDR
jgi:DNA-binding transcriptional ArsR family regulator